MLKFDPVKSKLPSDEFAYGIILLNIYRGATSMRVSDCAGGNQK